MTIRDIEPKASDRLIVFAPHPDDETLACGGLIQRAVHQGAAVMVVIATGGDANPWPQRFVERRWRIDAAAAARWAFRRHSEAKAALSILGLGERDSRFLGWEDQGLTRRLMEHGEASASRLRDILLQFRPTIIAMPSHLDSHPDHSALALLLRSAIASVGCPARCLAYWLHGRQAGFVPVVLQLGLTQREVSTKRTAALAHASQTQFGTSRLLRFVGPAEQFIEATHLPSPASDTWHWEFVASGLLNRIAIRRMRIVAIAADGTLHAATLPLKSDATTGLTLERRGLLRLEATVAAPWSKPAWLAAKLEHRHGLFVYDAMGWAERRPAHPSASEDAPSDDARIRSNQAISYAQAEGAELEPASNN